VIDNLACRASDSVYAGRYTSSKKDIQTGTAGKTCRRAAARPGHLFVLLSVGLSSCVHIDMFVRACLRDSLRSRTEISVASKYSLRHKVRARCRATTDVVCAAKNIYRYSRAPCRSIYRIQYTCIVGWVI